MTWLWTVADLLVDELPAWLRRHHLLRVVFLAAIVLIPPAREAFMWVMVEVAQRRIAPVMDWFLHTYLPSLP